MEPGLKGNLPALGNFFIPKNIRLTTNSNLLVINNSTIQAQKSKNKNVTENSLLKYLSVHSTVNAPLQPTNHITSYKTYKIGSTVPYIYIYIYIYIHTHK
jgi:hypothetical protein